MLGLWELILKYTNPFWGKEQAHRTGDCVSTFTSMFYMNQTLGKVFYASLDNTPDLWVGNLSLKLAAKVVRSDHGGAEVCALRFREGLQSLS